MATSAVDRDGSGPALFFGGEFPTSASGDGHLAEWTLPCTSGAPDCFGDGLRCATGSMTGLGTKLNVGGSSQFPTAGDPSLSVAGLVAAPGTRAYQVWYRNAVSFSTASTINLSNGWQTTWVP